MKQGDLGLVPGARVLLADRDRPGALKLAEHLETIGHIPLVATDGEAALRRIRCDDPELLLLDAGMPGLNAYQLCERVKSHPTTRFLPVVMLVSPTARDERQRAVEVGADDFLSRPVQPLEMLLRVRALVRLKRLEEQAEKTEEVIFGLAEMLNSKITDDRSNPHRMAHYACMLGRLAGVSESDLEVLRKGAILHDVGKIAVPESVLLKPGRLSEDEFDEVKRHPEVGELICAPLRCPEEVLLVVRHHQERWDGLGYPDRLRGEQIPLLARILAIADAYDAMLSPRPHRPALTPEEAQANLRAGAGSQWDPRLVELFLSALASREAACGVGEKSRL